MQVFALVDGNSFFASCEKVFRPDLTDRPVIVLSNNDGCVVARSKEAKKLGIKMCQPYFEIDEFCLRENVAVFSSNYELYANLSGRMMSTIASQVDCIDPYSIDECFANMSGYEGLGTDLTQLGFRIKDKVFKDVGIPTCVGIAPTKTLAKYCNHLAKHYAGLKGVCNWLDLTPQRQAKALACEPVSEIWGVGRRYTEHLGKMGIRTALDLACADAEAIRDRFGITLSMTVRELQGTSCIPLELVKPKRQQIQFQSIGLRQRRPFRCDYFPRPGMRKNLAPRRYRCPYRGNRLKHKSFPPAGCPAARVSVRRAPLPDLGYQHNHSLRSEITQPDVSQKLSVQTRRCVCRRSRSERRRH